MFDGGPKHARAKHHVTVGLEIDRKAPVRAIGEGSADCSRRVVTDAVSARATDVMIVLVHWPQPGWPRRKLPVAAHRGPIEILDLRVDLHGQARGADWAGVPRVGSSLSRAIARLGPGLLH